MIFIEKKEEIKLVSLLLPVWSRLCNRKTFAFYFAHDFQSIFIHPEYSFAWRVQRFFCFRSIHIQIQQNYIKYSVCLAVLLIFIASITWTESEAARQMDSRKINIQKKKNCLAFNLNEEKISTNIYWSSRRMCYVFYFKRSCTHSALCTLSLSRPKWIKIQI